MSGTDDSFKPGDLITKAAVENIQKNNAVLKRLEERHKEKVKWQIMEHIRELNPDTPFNPTGLTTYRGLPIEGNEEAVLEDLKRMLNKQGNHTQAPAYEPVDVIEEAWLNRQPVEHKGTLTTSNPTAHATVRPANGHVDVKKLPPLHAPPSKLAVAALWASLLGGIASFLGFIFY